MAYGIIYELLCTSTGFRYIGQTIDLLAHRWRGHCDGALKKKLDWEISKAIRQFGPENFERRIICECESKKELNQQERHFIREFNTVWPNGYNMTNGGEGPCELTRQKIRQKLLGRKPSRESIEKTRAKTTGQKRSLEVRKKMSESALARGPHGPLSDDHKRKISELHKGKKRSAETRAKMSQNRKGKKSTFTPEQEAYRKARHLEATFGKKRPEFVGRKISEVKAKKFPLEVRQSIVTYREQGLSFDKIAELTGIARTTVFRLYQKSKR